MTDNTKNGLKKAAGDSRLVTPLNDGGAGRVSIAYTKAVTYEREGSLWDTEIIRDRDAIVRQIQEAKEIDRYYSIERRDKPIALSSYQSRILVALSSVISKQIDSEDIKEKIKALREGKNTPKIEREISIDKLTYLIFNSTRGRYKEKIIKELYRLADIRQAIIYNYGETRIVRRAPLITLGEDFTIEDNSINTEDKKIDSIIIQLQDVFFVELDERFAYIPRNTFEVWQKKGRGTELYSVLLHNLWEVYWQFVKAADKAEETIRKDKKLYTNKETLEEAVREARDEALSFELNVSTIKKRVTTDYESNRANKKRFWTDLENAIEGYKEMDLIRGCKISKGASGQEKIIFILSDTYNKTNKDKISLESHLLEAKK